MRPSQAPKSLWILASHHCRKMQAMITRASQRSFYLLTRDPSNVTGHDLEVSDFLVPMAYDENWGAVSPKPNCPLAGLLRGLAQYDQLGVRMASLVVALPWYSTSWPCKNATQGAECVTELDGRSLAKLEECPMFPMP